MLFASAPVAGTFLRLLLPWRPQKKKRKVDSEGRRFQERWELEYFFTENRGNCVCLICKETVALFKDFNVKRHYETRHAKIYDKLTGSERAEKVKQLQAALASQQRFFTRACESNESITKASYEVAMLIAKHGKPLTEGTFVKDCIMKMVENICPEKKQEFMNVCLARNTVARRVEDLSSDILRQLGDRGVAFDYFSLACDESTDVSDTAQLLIFLRGVDDNMNVSEELLDLKSLKGLTRGTDLFVSVCEAVDDMKLPWSKVSGIITDGAPAMAGERSGLSTLICNKVSEEAGNAIKLHCIIHQQALCAKHLKFDDVMKPVAKVINSIRSKALYHRQFQQFLRDIQAEYGDLIYYNDVRWLSRGSALQRFFSLKEEIRHFLDEKGQPMKQLSDPVWLANLAFLVDITKHLNELNVNLQGKDAVVSQLYAHIKAFGIKLQLFQRHLSLTEPCTAHFPALKEVIDSFPQDNIDVQMKGYVTAIASLSVEFNKRFQDFAVIEKDMLLFSSPLSADPDNAPPRLQLELIELQCDYECRGKHQQCSLVDFYRQLDKGRFPEMRSFAKKMLSLFGSTYLCEQTFSVMNLNKNRLRSKMSDSHLRDILRISTTAIKPDLVSLLKSRSQYHPSH
ncbi:general transcription factor II-I repeat domain-containing protein 2-like [Danio rerio]|uniref:General transcription factor II-I repeat domain-containing protein 2-like n=1 Tax=Danio rerio TaxID=7955 RepID=A0AC58JLP5_DANRE|nr:general transcription factor II-I repeat domain-containing protein 2-like [Danio rerio]|eukprot:XP_009300010.1 general transcription factor II-I repeat domain-containing protein 2-like [Danio rerio]